MPNQMTQSSPLGQRIGPVLFLHGLSHQRIRLHALLVRPETEPVPALNNDQAAVLPERLYAADGIVVLRYTFSLPATADAAYELDGRHYTVNADLGGDLRVAYVSCNGQERGDRERDPDERNALWQRLAAQHAQAPFQLMLHGGDQLYADEMLDVHARLRAWADGETGPPLSDGEADTIRQRLRSHLLERYLELYSQPEPAWLMARAPIACMWDDHDICDGWGSLPPARLDAPVGRLVFEVAREFFLLFQLGARPDEPPGHCIDPRGTTLGWSLRLPGVTWIAPDLRSERRPDRVMGPTGETAFRSALEAAPEGHVFVLSSVPALGPRLSWVEAVMHLTPRAEKYEDDLRDQWQSRAHRDEWRAFLERLLATHESADHRVTVLSGEIHLATRATMAARDGPVHQLVASGITHPPPPLAYARTLGALARLGESPVAGHPIRLHPLPGQKGIYTAQRNYLVLERRDGAWRAWWELEHDGATPPLDLEQ